MDRLIATNSVVAAQADTPPAAGTPQYATSGNPAGGIPATVFPAYQYNAMQEELIAIIAASGIAPDRTNNAQVIAAINSLLQTRSGSYGIDTGAANAYVVDLAPAPAALTDGMVIIFRAGNPNNGPSTLDVNGFGAFNIIGAGGALQGGEILTGASYVVCYVSATNTWSLIGQGSGAISAQPATKSRHVVNLEQMLVVSSVVATSSGTVNVSVSFTAPCKGVVLVTGIGGGSGSTGVQITGTNVTLQNGATVWAAGTGAATVSMATGLVASGAAVTLTSTIDNATTSFSGIYCLFLPSI